MTKAKPRPRVFLGIAVSLAGLLLIAAAVVATFAAALAWAEDPRPRAQALAPVAGDGQRLPDMVGRVVGVWGDALVLDTAGGRRTLNLHAETAIRMPDGRPGERADVRAGLIAAVFGAPQGLETFRVDLILLRPAP